MEPEWWGCIDTVLAPSSVRFNAIGFSSTTDKHLLCAGPCPSHSPPRALGSLRWKRAEAGAVSAVLRALQTEEEWDFDEIPGK